MADAERHRVSDAGEPGYESYYGLTGKPFSLSTAMPALYRSPTHTVALESLRGALRRREGLVALIGEPGTGKTTVCRAALDGLDRKTFTSFVPDPAVSREDLLRTLLIDFGHVSVDTLRRGRFSRASRLELWHQLREFLASVESRDPSVVLVLDEAHRLAPPLIDEVRALSELEGGCAPLQIVLVGPPELRSHLKTPDLRQIDQRVTTRCELRPLTTDEVADYVAHRLAMVNGARARISFAPAAIEMIRAAADGLPRLVNVVCDRAMSCGHRERTSVIGPPVVACALEELQLAPAPVIERAEPPAPIPDVAAPHPSASAPTVSEVPRGLFEKRPDAGSGRFEMGGLDALLALPATSPRFEQEATAGPRSVGTLPTPGRLRDVVGDTRRWGHGGVFKIAALAVFGMVVMSIVGGLVVTAQRERPPLPAAAAGYEPEDAPPAESLIESIAAANPSAPRGTWAVQVAAFESPERAGATVRQLAESGFPAFEGEEDTAAHGLLRVVRVGPFETPGDAADASEKLRQLPDYRDAFVVNVAAP